MRYNLIPSLIAGIIIGYLIGMSFLAFMALAVEPFNLGDNALVGGIIGAIIGSICGFNLKYSSHLAENICITCIIILTIFVWWAVIAAPHYYSWWNILFRYNYEYCLNRGQ